MALATPAGVNELPDETFVDPAPAGADPFAARYRLLEKIGAGGMGEVHRAHDGHIGREIAIKLCHRTAGHAGDRRFLDEARLQGRLEHPAVVPVHEIAGSATMGPYFTMKRVRGQTLEEILEALRRDDHETLERYPRARLLGAFVNVCLAVDFAHAQGVLHRDVKPSNIMLGDFGEVYLLDWGLAKVGTSSGERERERSRATPRSLVRLTEHDEVVGTPGFMSPEQLRGEPLDARSDIYSLGAVLFEILTLEPLVRGRTPAERIEDTLAGVEARPTLRGGRRGETPQPELELACLRATRLDPGKRFASARELSRAVERWLDGDRDLERRRQLADGHATVAAIAAERSLSGGLAERRRALREVGRALALDPTHDRAMHTLVRLLSHPPAHAPELGDEADAAEREHVTAAARAGVWAYLSWLLFLPLALWMGVKSWPLLLASGASWLVAACLAWRLARRPRPEGRVPWTLMTASAAATASVSLLFGCFLATPMLVALNTAIFSLGKHRGGRLFAMATGIAGLVAPAVLESAGVLPPVYTFTGDTIVVTSHTLHLPATATWIYLLLVGVCTTTVTSLVVGRLRARFSASDHGSRVAAWQLRQLVPAGPGSTAPLERRDRNERAGLPS